MENKSKKKLGRVLVVNDKGEVIVLSGYKRLTGKLPSSEKGLSIGDLISFSIKKQRKDLIFYNINILKKYEGIEDFPPQKSDFFRFHKKGSEVYKNINFRFKIINLIRKFFINKGFIEVETPSIAVSPGVEPHLFGVEVKIPYKENKNLRRFLISSPEFYMKRLISVGFEKIFQISHAFRGKEIGDHHQFEFTILEWYRAGVNYYTIMEDVEELFLFLSKNFYKRDFIEYQGKRVEFSKPWEKKTFREVMKDFGGVEDIRGMKEDEIFKNFVEKVECNLRESGKPLIIYEYSKEMASLAKIKNDAPDVAERFEVYIAGIEIANGFTELIDAKEQLKRFKSDIEKRKRQKINVYPVDHKFIEALQAGLFPCAGIALGIDRLIMLMLNASSIDKVISFPFEFLENE